MEERERKRERIRGRERRENNKPGESIPFDTFCLSQICSGWKRNLIHMREGIWREGKKRKSKEIRVCERERIKE